jgi:hypothetical protein
VPGYLQNAVRAICKTGAFVPAAWPEDAPDRLPTSYAIKYQQEGRPLYHARFVRASRREDAEAGTEMCREQAMVAVESAAGASAAERVKAAAGANAAEWANAAGANAAEWAEAVARADAVDREG